MTQYGHPFFIAILFFIPYLSLGSFTFGPDAEKAYSAYMELRIEEGNSITKRLLEANPNDGIAIYLQNLGDVLPILLEDDHILYEKLKGNESQRIKQLKELEKTSPYFHFTQAQVRLQWAIVKFSLDEQAGALLDLRMAYKLILANAEEHPEFTPNKIPFGLLNILLGSIPEEIRWISNSIGLKGDITEGLNLLNTVAQSNSVFKLEGAMYYNTVQYFLFEKEEALDAIQELHQTNRGNLLLTFVYANVLFKSGRNDDALYVLKYRPRSANYADFHFLDYLLAEAYLQKLDYNAAIIKYSGFIRNYGGKNFIRSSYYKLFVAHWLSGDKEKAMKYLNVIEARGQNITTPDNYATEFAKDKEIPNIILMEVRLLTDGGYLQEAFKKLEPVTISSFNTHQEQVEYVYRKGRLLHKMKNIEPAKVAYKEVMSLTRDDDRMYFAPNSCLQLGLLFLENRDTEQARKYLERVLEYPKHPYKTELDHRAKLELDKLVEE